MPRTVRARRGGRFETAPDALVPDEPAVVDAAGGGGCVGGCTCGWVGGCAGGWVGGVSGQVMSIDSCKEIRLGHFGRHPRERKDVVLERMHTSGDLAR